MLNTAVRRAVDVTERKREALPKLSVKLFADGAERLQMLEMYRNPLIKGFTTNPTLMRKAGVGNYEAFARDILSYISDRSISFEVFADDLGEMERQARKIASWGTNVFVKIPITNTIGESSLSLVRRLSSDGIKVNVTALMTLQQVLSVTTAVEGGAQSYISVFAGRIADTGRDPVPIMAAAAEIIKCTPNAELIWASPRELLNVIQANDVGCQIITASQEILAKIEFLGKDLPTFSLETVRMFHRDASASQFRI